MHCKMNIYVLLCLMSIWKRLDFEVAKLFAVTGKVIKLQHKCYLGICGTGVVVRKGFWCLGKSPAGFSGLKQELGVSQCI
jgi:hypothetical protein